MFIFPFPFPCKDRSRDPIQKVPEEIFHIPFPTKQQFLWKCLISRDFPVPCRKIPWKYIFPKSRAN